MSIFQRIRRGAASLLGGFGRAIISRIQAIGGRPTDVVEAIARTGVQPDPFTVAQEWHAEWQFKERAPAFATLDPTLNIPRELYTQRQMKYGTKYVYTVSIYGRDLATGRFTEEKRDIWTSRETTKEELIDYAVLNLNQDGVSEQFAIINAQVLGASIRAGDYFD